MRTRHKTAAALALLALGGCGALDPFGREGAWRPTAANQQNLRAQLAVPTELTLGTADPHAPAAGAVTAMERLRADRVRPLPASGVATINATGSRGAE
jgi:hypothetical protein